MATTKTRRIENFPDEAPPPEQHTRPTTNGTSGRVVPHDLGLEAVLIGATLIRPSVNVDLLRRAAHALYSTSHQRIADSILRIADSGATPDRALIEADLRRHGLLQPNDRALLVELEANCPRTTGLDAHVTELLELHEITQRIRLGQRLVDAGYARDLTAVRHAVDELTTTRPATITGLDHNTLAQFIDTDDTDFDWIIPGLLERGDRVLLTAGEGQGKSTLLRQIAVQTAAGIHPFRLTPIDPLTVVLLDLENSRRHVRRQLRPLRTKADGHADHNLHVIAIPQGLDLTDTHDAAAFTATLDELAPDLVLGGPVYKLVDGDPTEEGPAKAAAMLLDQLRVRIGFALILETHQPHETGAKKRPERPYGASLWKRWPEFGLHLSDTGTLRHWRGDRDERDWPKGLVRGGEWPWTVALADDDPNPAGTPSTADYVIVADVIRCLATNPGAPHSKTALLAAMRAAGYRYRDADVVAAADEAARLGDLHFKIGLRNSHLYTYDPEAIQETLTDDF